MTALKILVKLIRDSEGCKLTAYQCPAGVWTIGWGYTGSDIKKGLVWTQEKADECLLVTAMKVLDEALSASSVLKTSTVQRQAAIADIIYNIGIGAYKKSTLKKYIDLGNFQSASIEILKWDKANGKQLKGLSIRRKKESDLLKI